MFKDPLRGYPANSVGGQAIQRGRDAYDAGEPVPRGWPYLAERGWYDRKEEDEYDVLNEGAYYEADGEIIE